MARTFYPKNISLDGPEGHIVYDLKAPLITSEGMYSTWKVIGVKPDAKGTCKAVHKRNETAASTILPGTMFVVQAQTDSGRCLFRDTFLVFEHLTGTSTVRKIFRCVDMWK